MESIKDFTLTPREEEIISQLALGLGYKEIASKVFISPETVKQHLKNIYKKMGVNNRMKAALLYNYGQKSFA